MKPNWPLLAGLRFVLAVMVCLGHTASTIGDFGASYYDHFSGFASVGVFFLVSGYCMAHSYTGEPAGFFRRRFWRIAPVYWAGCLVALSPFWIFGGNLAVSFDAGYRTPSFRTFLPILLGLGPMVRMNGVIFDVALWSVCVECAFYLAVPLINRLPDWGLIVVMALSLALTAVRFDYLGPNLYGQTLWLFCLGYLLYRRPDSRVVQVLAFALPTLGMIPAVLRGWSTGADLFAPEIALGGACILVFGRNWQLPERMQGPALYLGDLSYPLYICFWPVAWLIFFDDQMPVILKQTPFALVAQLAVAAVILHAVDRPLRRFGREPKFRGGRSRRGLVPEPVGDGG